MASKKLIIDDEYCQKMGKYFIGQGEHMDQVISEYITILNSIKKNAIMAGDVSKALTSYIQYATRLKSKIGQISKNGNAQVGRFLKQVDEEDEYIF